MVRPGSMRARLVADRVATERPGTFETVAIAVVSIGLAAAYDSGLPTE